MIEVAAGFISVPLTLNYLGAERFGLWVTISSLVLMVRFMDFGLGNGLVNAITEAEAKGDRDGAAVYSSTAVYMFAALGAVLFVLLSVAGFTLPLGVFFGVESEIALKELPYLVLVMSIILGLNLPLGALQKLQMGRQEGYRWQLWAVAGSIMGLIFLLLAIELEAGLPWLIFGLTGGPVLASITNALDFFRHRAPELAPRWRNISFPAADRLIKSGGVFMLLNALAFIGYSVDGLVIANILGAVAVATFGVVQRLFSVVGLGRLVLTPFWPAFGEAAARGDDAWVKRALSRLLIGSLALHTITALALFLGGHWIIRVWIGPELVVPDTLLAGFAVWAVVSGYIGVMSVLFNSGRLLARQLIFFAPACICSFALKIWLVPEIGPAGVVWASVIAFSAIYVIPAWFMASRHLHSGITQAGID